MAITYTTTSHRATESLGAKLGQELRGGETLLLTGNLGAGKTTFVKGLARGLGVRQTITSPTYVIMKVYPTKHKNIRQFVHVDCYRLPAGRQGVPGVELSAIGLEDYLGDAQTVVAIEWAGKLKRSPPRSIQVQFSTGSNKTERRITVGKPKRAILAHKRY